MVFTLFIILFRFSRFVRCSCDSVSVGLLGTVAYSFSRVGSSFLICCFWLAPLDVFGGIIIIIIPNFSDQLLHVVFRRSLLKSTKLI